MTYDLVYHSSRLGLCQHALALPIYGAQSRLNGILPVILALVLMLLVNSTLQTVCTEGMIHRYRNQGVHVPLLDEFLPLPLTSVPDEHAQLIRPYHLKLVSSVLCSVVSGVSDLFNYLHFLVGATLLRLLHIVPQSVLVLLEARPTALGFGFQVHAILHVL